jgi:hypothetical protein
MREIVGKALAEFLIGVDDLDQCQRAVTREKAIRDGRYEIALRKVAERAGQLHRLDGNVPDSGEGSFPERGDHGVSEGRCGSGHAPGHG